MLRPKLNVSCLPELELILQRNERLDASDRARFTQQAEKLFRTHDAFQGWVILSAIAATDWDLASVHSYIEKGVRAVGRLPRMLANFAVTLEHVLRFDLAADLTEEVLRAEPHDYDWVVHHSSELFMLGRLTDAVDVIGKYVAGTGDVRAEGLLEDYSTSCDALVEAGVEEARLQRELELAYAVLREAKVRVKQLEIRDEEDPDSGEVSITAALAFLGDIELEIKLGAKLSAGFADLGAWDPCKLSTEVEYVDSEDVHVAA